jgi:hypothetical protein
MVRTDKNNNNQKKSDLPMSGADKSERRKNVSCETINKYM